ncbi:MAG: carboxylating nicotinate-nucleotide diphosphorylase [Deltaproteobacteria bacterium]|nr:carboxylating nicotinate-nucleotide diphosphorylase [Deltaproteobacteria bacterium]
MPLLLTIDSVVSRALEEDLASGDLTSEACVGESAVARAEAIARHEMIACGGDVFRRVFQLVDPSSEVILVKGDGVLVRAGEVLWQARGKARSLLMAERVALNFAQRMSGIATLAHRYASAIPAGSTTRIADTRKTTPGLRALERYAVRTGGAHNHRDDLGSAVMIKDNHIVAAGGIAAAVVRARARAPHTCRVEVEVTNPAELEEALAAGADIVMLDNMDDDAVRAAVARCRAEGTPPRGPVVEASGGITLERIPRLAAAGVDVISVGALTHSAPAADISLEFTPAS